MGDVRVATPPRSLTAESPELYRRSGVGYGLACIGDSYALTQVAAGWRAFYTHVFDGSVWRRARQTDFALLPDEAKAAGTCLIFDDAQGAWHVSEEQRKVATRG